MPLLAASQQLTEWASGLHLPEQRNTEMKHILLCSLLATGLLAAKTRADKTYVEDGTQARLSSNERVALETSSPRVHLKHRNGMMRAGYRVTKDKHTINAFVPVGK